MKTTIPASANQPSTMMPIPMAATYVSASSGAARAMAQDRGQDDEPDDAAANSVVLGPRGAVHRATSGTGSAAGSATSRNLLAPPRVVGAISFG
jgi:hypothetical protein